MSILTDIYNTVAKFFRPQEDAEDASKSVATNRLKLVLMQDRTNLTPQILEQMRGELIDLLSRYVEMDKELLELNFEQEGDQVALMLSIPVIRAKDEDEIEAILEKEKQEKAEAAESSEETNGQEDETAEEAECPEISAEEVETTGDEENAEVQNVSAPKEMASSKKEISKEECPTEK